MWPSITSGLRWILVMDFVVGLVVVLLLMVGFFYEVVRRRCMRRLMACRLAMAWGDGRSRFDRGMRSF
ncbi:hypothetical protein DOT79_23075 [Ralstonia pseudosolanacearum]|nr:hypothetical protein DOT79_23075 [Ralstonia pseudosolanacearum]